MDYFFSLNILNALFNSINVFLIKFKFDLYSGLFITKSFKLLSHNSNGRINLSLSSIES